MKLTKGLIAKRRAIAKDVVVQVRAKRFNAESGTYIELACTLPQNGEELQQVLKKGVTRNKPCQVCAIGSVFLSAVIKFDQFKLRGSAVVGGGYISNGAMRKKVSEFFTAEEQLAMESSFERQFQDDYARYNDFLYELDDTERLLWLMRAVERIADKEITIEALRNQALISIATDPDFVNVREQLQLI